MNDKRLPLLKECEAGLNRLNPENEIKLEHAIMCLLDAAALSDELRVYADTHRGIHVVANDGLDVILEVRIGIPRGMLRHMLARVAVLGGAPLYGGSGIIYRTVEGQPVALSFQTKNTGGGEFASFKKRCLPEK